MKKEQKAFCVKHGITEKQFTGEEKVGGYLYLSGLTSIPDGFNPTVGGSLYLSGLTSIPDGFNPTVGGYLYLRGLTSIPDGFNPTVGGSLYLSGLTSIPDGFDPTVGGYLDLSGLTSIPDGFNPTVGGSLYLSGLTSIPDGFNPTVGGSLYLSGLTSIPDGFNPTVGGYLYLRGLTSIPDGFNPTVGGSLYLSGLTSIPDGFNPTVGGYLDLSGLTSIPDGFNPTVGGYLDLSGSLHAETKDPPHVLTWNDEQYCLVDGIFGAVISRTTKAGTEIWKLRKLGREDVFFMVERDGVAAHGNSVRDAMLDLRFKVEDRDPSDYEDLTPESELSFDDAVVCYRVITGACQFGVRDFLDNRLPKQKPCYLVSEIIELTANEYGGNTFAKFFGAANREPAACSA